MHKCAITQNIVNIMLSEKQINNLHKLPSDDLLIIMHECAEALGVVSVDKYCRIMGEKRRTVYQKITDNKIKYFSIVKHKFPIINC